MTCIHIRFWLRGGIFYQSSIIQDTGLHVDVCINFYIKMELNPLKYKALPMYVKNRKLK